MSEAATELASMDDRLDYSIESLVTLEAILRQLPDGPRHPLRQHIAYLGEVLLRGAPHGRWSMAPPLSILYRYPAIRWDTQYADPTNLVRRYASPREPGDTLVRCAQDLVTWVNDPTEATAERLGLTTTTNPPDPTPWLSRRRARKGAAPT